MRLMACYIGPYIAGPHFWKGPFQEEMYMEPCGMEVARGLLAIAGGLTHASHLEHIAGIRQNC